MSHADSYSTDADMPGSAPAPADRSGIVDLFFLTACRKGYVTETQCSILKGMTGNALSLDGILSLIALWKVGAKRRDEIKGLAQEIEAMGPDEASARIQEMRQAPPRMIAVVPLELQWFCYLAVQRKLLTEEQCVELDAELGQKRDFLSFAQAVVVILPKDKFPLIQQSVELSMEYANTGSTPPLRILDPSMNFNA